MSKLNRLAAELALLDREVPFDFSHATAGHAKQLAYVQDKAKYVIAMCSRRAGKSTGNVFKMSSLAASRRSNILYLSLTRAQAKKTMWTEGLWLDHCKLYYPESKHNVSDLTTVFPNGSTVAFAGATDEGNVATKLGSKLHLAVIDESQSSRSALLHRLVFDTLPPALSDDGGQLVLSGTIPEVPAGFFWERWNSQGWSRHTWSRFENPHLRDQEKRLEEFLAASGLEPNDPLVLRDWRGQAVFDPTALAFRYDAERNGYGMLSADELVKLDTFAAGVDPGARDRCAIVVVGWGRLTPDVYVVDEWVTPRNAGTAWSAVGRELQRFHQKWKLSRIFADFGGSTMTLDTMQRDFGIPMVMAATKRDRRGQVDRLNDLLQRGIFQVPRKSQVARDFERTQWDADSLAAGHPEWSSANHPDVADACRYAVQAFFESYERPKDRRRDWVQEQIEAERMAIVQEYRPPVQYGPMGGPPDDGGGYGPSN